ncbi:MAG TPA: cytochrome c [Caulobacteraceae bacterium]|nr:cytochrome c [Caulobacteraceae bacterium]
MKAKFLLPIVAMTALSTLAYAAPPPDPQVEAGRRVALKACSGCHAIDRGRSDATNAPPFRTLYKRMKVDDLPLRFEDGMMMGHGEMPIVRLGADEVAELTAYLKSLGPMGSRPRD